MLQLEKQSLKLKENKAEEDSLRETRDELTRRLRTLEDVTAAGKQVGIRDAATSRMLSGEICGMWALTTHTTKYETTSPSQTSTTGANRYRPQSVRHAGKHI